MKRREFFALTLPLSLAFVSEANDSSTTEPLLRFGVIADPQYKDAKPAGTRYYKNSLAKLEVAIANLNQEKLAFVVTLGDLIDADFSSFAPVMKQYAALAAPHFPILGNHDFSVTDDEKSQVLAALGMEKPYYSRILNGWRFLFLDGTDVGTWRYPANDDRTAAAIKMREELLKNKTPQAAEWNAGIGKEQLRWIDEELTAAATAKQPAILFCHYPICPLAQELNLWNDQEVSALLQKHPHALAWMNGHNHEGNYGKLGHVHCLNFKGMVETENQTAYATVACYQDRLVIQGYGLEPKRDLKKSAAS